MSRCCAINCPSETTIVDLSVSDDHGKEWPIGRICAVHEAMVEGGFMFYALCASRTGCACWSCRGRRRGRNRMARRYELCSLLPRSWEWRFLLIAGLYFAAQMVRWGVERGLRP